MLVRPIRILQGTTYWPMEIFLEHGLSKFMGLDWPASPELEDVELWGISNNAVLFCSSVMIDIFFALYL